MPKYKLPVRARYKKLNDNEPPYVILKEVNQAGTILLQKLFAKKKEWEERNKREFKLWVEFDLRYQDRTLKQNSSVWLLIECIWASMEEDPPTEDEKYALYLDLLEVYADKTKNRINGALRPVHISEANSMEGARFIDGLLYHLATMCSLDYNAQSTVIEVLQNWEAWRGEQDIDPVDYADLECTRLLTEAEWREKHPYSEASGQGGDIVLHHIVTRGSNKAAEDKAWNWLAMTAEEHSLLHTYGNEWFLTVYSHLKGRVRRAERLASLIQGQKDTKSLADQARED